MSVHTFTYNNVRQHIILQNYVNITAYDLHITANQYQYSSFYKYASSTISITRQTLTLRHYHPSKRIIWFHANYKMNIFYSSSKSIYKRRATKDSNGIFTMQIDEIIYD